MFDIERMKEILEGDFYRMPRGMTRDEMREYIKDVAEGRVEPVFRKGRFSFDSNQAKTLGDDMMEHYTSLADKVTLTKEQLKKSGEESLKAYGEVDNLSNDKVFMLEEFIQL